MMARIQRCPVMIYGSLQAEFMETKYNSQMEIFGIKLENYYWLFFQKSNWITEFISSNFSQLTWIITS